MSTFGTVSLSKDIAIFNRWGGTSYGMVENVEAIARARNRVTETTSPEDPEFLALVVKALPDFLPPGSFIMLGKDAQDRRSVSFDLEIDVTEPKAPSVFSFYDMTEEEPYQADDEENDFPVMPKEAMEPLSWEDAARLSEIIDGYEKESEYYLGPENGNEWYFLSTE